MLSKVECVLVKAQAISRWNNFSLDEQPCLLKLQFFGLSKKEKNDKKAAHKARRANKVERSKYHSTKKRNRKTRLRRLKSQESRTAILGKCKERT